MSTDNDKSFLVFSGGNDRAILAFLRALRRCGKRASIVARTLDDKILRTQFHRDVRCIRDSHALDMDVFTNCVSRVREYTGNGTLVVLPSTEYFNDFILQHRDEVEKLGCQVPLTDAFTYRLLTAKRSATDLFLAEGFNVPDEYPNTARLELPIVAKPLCNVSSEGKSLYPKLLVTPRQLDAFHAAHRLDEYFFQEYVSGKSLYLLFYLSRDGKFELKSSQRNLLQQPEGKSMLFAESSDFHQSPSATRMINLLRKHGFWGLGMIEVIQTKDRLVFIEMNPRIWGPIQFCIDQRQPLLESFIGDALHEDPSRFIAKSPYAKNRTTKYFWLGGLAYTLASGKRPVWHGKKPAILTIVASALQNDVYLRADSWRCFLYELIQALKLALHHEHAEK